MNRREFLITGSVAALGAGCSSSFCGSRPATRSSRSEPGGGEFYVFSKMFQPPVTKSVEELCELMKGAGFDGIQWTVRKGGHVAPENAAVDLPRVCRIANSFGLKSRTICTDIKPEDATAEGVLKVAADCGITMQRPAYFFYDAQTETFTQSMKRIHRGFDWFAALSERTGVKTTYQNHSSWGPSVFGGLVWDIYECVKDIDPQYVGVEYDPMHAFLETNLSWTHGFDLIAPWISSIDLKDFHYSLDPKDPKMLKKAMVAAGEGVVPWGDVRGIQERNNVSVPYIVHFEYSFDEANLKNTATGELRTFKRVLGL